MSQRERVEDMGNGIVVDDGRQLASGRWRDFAYSLLPTPALFIFQFENGHERFLRHLHRADHFHALLTLLLFLE